jgi:predicted metal-dependent HD superfamily phosphohydrolase
MNLELILQKAEEFVREWFANRVPAHFTYHTFEHTRKVVGQTVEISRAEGVSESRAFALAMASWFHDTGFGLGIDNHELLSCEVFEEFALRYPDAIEFKEEIKDLIKATEYTRKPQNLDEKILRDADLHYLGTDEYEVESNALRSEWANVLGKNYSDREWLQINVDFLTSHQFYTSFASHKFEAIKLNNLEWVRQTLHHS